MLSVFSVETDAEVYWLRNVLIVIVKSSSGFSENFLIRQDLDFVMITRAQGLKISWRKQDAVEEVCVSERLVYRNAALLPLTSRGGLKCGVCNPCIYPPREVRGRRAAFLYTMN